MAFSEDELGTTSDKSGTPNTPPEAQAKSGTKLWATRKYKHINRHANGVPPPGVAPAKRKLDKALLETESDEDGDESQGSTQPSSKKAKQQNDDLDDSSSNVTGTPPLTSSNNNCMLFFLWGGAEKNRGAGQGRE